MTNICGQKGSSASFRECTITLDGDDKSLPHGDIDVVAGHIEKSGVIFGIQLFAAYELATRAPSMIVLLLNINFNGECTYNYKVLFYRYSSSS